MFRTLVAALVLLPVVAMAAPEAKVKFKLSPTGSFAAETTSIIGTAKKNSDGSVSADKIEIPLDTLKTGISLRDKHMKEKHLDVKKHPKAIVTNAEGKDGKGTATLNVRGIEKPIEGTYEIKGSELILNFPIKITDYDIGKVKYMGLGVKEDANVEARIPIQ